MPLQPYFDWPFCIGFDINGFDPCLDADTTYATPGNHTVSYWSVDDINKVAEKLLSIGATLFQPRTTVGGPNYVAIVEVPFGNHIGLIAGR